MDGLAAGVSAIAAVFIGVGFAVNGQMTEAAMLAVFAAALVGFLVYNTNPATIFMGDCGSMFVGFFLASSALLSASGERGRSFIVVIADGQAPDFEGVPIGRAELALQLAFDAGRRRERELPDQLLRARAQP